MTRMQKLGVRMAQEATRELSSRTYWSDEQARQFVRDLLKRLGNAWGYMHDRVREAVVAEEAFRIVRIQARDAVPVEAMDQLLRQMRGYAGLDESR